MVFAVQVIECRRGIGCASSDVKAVEVGQQPLQPLDCQRFIIHEIGAKRSGFHGHYQIMPERSVRTTVFSFSRATSSRPAPP